MDWAGYYHVLAAAAPCPGRRLAARLSHSVRRPLVVKSLPMESGGTSPPDILCSDYIVEDTLIPGRTYLARDPSARAVALKVLDSDCLLRGQLHPMVRDRLSRVRELAHLGVAHLFGVERDGDRYFLIWQYLHGQTLEQRLASEEINGNFKPIALRLVSAVESLHALGIVHGALHERNIILAPDGRILLTHISPLLYNDPQVDIDAVTALLGQMDCLHLPEAQDQQLSLHQLSLHLTRCGCGADSAADAACDSGGNTSRRLSLLGACAAALLGIALAWGAVQFAFARSAQKSNASPEIPRSLRPQ